MSKEKTQIDKIHDQLLTFAKNRLSSTKPIFPMVHAEDASGKAFVLMLENGVTEETTICLKEAFAMSRIVCFGVISEAWMLTEAKSPFIRPSKSDERIEGISITVLHKNGIIRSSVREISRDMTTGDVSLLNPMMDTNKRDAVSLGLLVDMF